WMSQANYIFEQLQITSDFQDYGETCLPYTTADHSQCYSIHSRTRPDGYLFLCPPNHCFPVPEHPNYFQLSQCPWFWSFDPNGRSRLTAEEAESHGFPCVEMEMEVLESSWDASVYEALRQFHAAKGVRPRQPGTSHPHGTAVVPAIR
ncbi:hypothetical protein FB45DRAFT_756413, partial [Roridomyces roridus]